MRVVSGNNVAKLKNKLYFFFIYSQPPAAKKTKLLPRNGSSDNKGSKTPSPVPRRNSSEELFFW